MRILLIRLGAFGDILHTLPLAADLAAAGHEVGWCCEDRWAPVLNGSPVVTRLHLLPRRLLRDRQQSLTTRGRALGSVLAGIRSSRYDAVIDAQGLAKSAALALASGIGLRLGHARPRAREGAWLVAHRRIASPAIHVIDQQRDLGRALGLVPEGPWRFPMPPWTAEHAWAAATLADLGLARPWMLNVGAGWPTKIWPEERQVELLRRLASLGVPVLVLWGNPAERAMAERVIAGAGHGVLAPDTDLPRLAALLRRAAVLVSGDTGPLHLALAMGVATVGLFGPVPADRNGPRGHGHRTLQAPGVLWERKDVVKGAMASITADQVLQAGQEASAESALSPDGNPHIPFHVGPRHPG